MIMHTPAQARQRGSRSHETGCEALILAHGQGIPKAPSGQQSTPQVTTLLLLSATADALGFFNSTLTCYLEKLKV